MGPDRATQTSGAHRRRGRSRRYAVVGSGVLCAGVVGYVSFVDPHHTDSVYPLCPFKLLTGWNCPACGGIRMTHDLLHGDLAASINDNIFLLVGTPVLAGWVFLRCRHGQPWLPIPAILTIMVAAIVWTVLRNFPGFPLVPTVLNR